MREQHSRRDCANIDSALGLARGGTPHRARRGPRTACGAAALLGALLALGGCGPSFGPNARNGFVFYCPGAGNVDFGDAGVREGLKRAGFRGEVGSIYWTVSFNVAVDQRLGNARLGAAALARKIEEYYEQFPDGEVDVVGLSAGTGVAIWGLENLDPKYKVNNVVLLGSSLWYKYDVSKALQRVKGKIYVYYSPNDAVLSGPMKLVGTIDGKMLDEAIGAGEVGLRSPRGMERVVNIAWRPEFGRYGYFGGHTDATNADFVTAELAARIIEGRKSLTQTAVPMTLAERPGAGSRD